jgi:hypothetical protein
LQPSFNARRRLINASHRLSGWWFSLWRWKFFTLWRRFTFTFRRWFPFYWRFTFTL